MSAALHILVVDDHPLVREGLRSVLKQVASEVEVLEAGRADEACRLVEARRDLDLILLDLALPDRDGFGVLEELRAGHADIPVVVLSASLQADDVLRSLRAGAAGFIPKSSSAGVMLGALRLVLAGGLYLPADILLAEGAPWQPPAPRDPPPAAPRPYVSARELGMSKRQAQVLALLVRGKTNKEIGQALDLAEQTVKAHTSAVLRTLNVNNRTHAAAVVAQLGIDLSTYSKA